MVRLRKRGPLRIVSNVPRTVPFVFLALPLSIAPAVHAQWTQYGGPSQDFAVEDQGIAEKWPDDGPRKIWSRKLGEGHSAILAEKDRLYTMYRDGKNEVVISLDAKTGKTLWDYRYRSSPHGGHDSQYGDGPNSTPLLAEGRLYTISIAGLMHCLDSGTGKVLWSHELWRDHKARQYEFGYSSSPVAYKDTVIAQMGGKAQAIAAFDATDGHIVFKALDFPLSFGTPRIMNLSGEDQLVVCTTTGVIGADPNTGKLHWHYPLENQWKQNIAMPALLGDDEFFISTFEAGSRRLKLVKDEGFRVEEVWSKRQPQFFYVSYVRLGDYIYGSSGEQTSSAISAVDVRTGKLVWRTRGFSLAHVVGLGNHLIILDDKGNLGLATPGPDGLKVDSTARLLQQPSRTAPTVVGKALYVRDMRNIMALDLG